ncbi:hypothetical protein COCON_G00146330 [Conger conger]|uniref:IF rod domain-containing protein n=2 Tax=Conger conger TaxID=82655 RepID=A0A9Q1HVK7_CONCO|nr:keratin, type I cytoskeletal 18-like isoform X3 [Conger conger]KAJ8265534.1 hypothetical protein COCON_G00146330 [Conger conger]
MSSYKSSSYSVRSSTAGPTRHAGFYERLSGGLPVQRAASIYGGAGGQGTRISAVSYSGVRGAAPAGSFSSSIQVSGSGGGAICSNEKVAMQHLNDRLATYLETVRNLELANNKLEVQIREFLENRGPDVNDYSRYNVVLEDLRKKVFDATVDNARLVLQIDNARLAADDFRVKFESELAIRQSVEADIVGLRKVIDDTNIGRMNLESEIEALREELIFLKKNHDNEVMELRNQIAQSGVQVDVDAPKGQDLSLIMEEIRAKYEKMALKNQEELKAWHESQMSEVQVQVTQNTEALQGARTEVNELRRQLQALEIELESQRTLKGSLEGTLRDTELRYNMEMEKYNTIILQLEAELTELRTNIQQQSQEYEALLNIKMKLEAEIATYRRLLDGGDFKLQDAVTDQRMVKTKVMTVTETLVDGKVVSSSTETRESKS